MGELIMMPIRNAEAQATERAATVEIDFSVWKKAPRERILAYFPTYSSVSKAMQAVLRGWVREWFAANVEILLRPHTAYAILV